MCVRSVVRSTKKNTRYQVFWFFVNIVKWSRCQLLNLKARVRFSQFDLRRDHVCFFYIFFSTFFLYHGRNSDTTEDKQHMSSAGRELQPACYNAIHACHPPAEQEATSRVCGTLSALYCYGFLLIPRGCFFVRTLPSVKLGGGLCCCVIHACCHRYNVAAAAVRSICVGSRVRSRVPAPSWVYFSLFL